MIHRVLSCPLCSSLPGKSFSITTTNLSSLRNFKQLNCLTGFCASNNKGNPTDKINSPGTIQYDSFHHCIFKTTTKCCTRYTMCTLLYSFSFSIVNRQFVWLNKSLCLLYTQQICVSSNFFSIVCSIYDRFVYLFSLYI